MKFKTVANITETASMLQKMRDRAEFAAGYLNRVVYPQILQIQLNRWRSEGASETGAWAPLNPSYARQKLNRYAAYAGGGRKILIATGRLVDSMTNPRSKDHFKMVEKNRLYVGSKVEYGGFVNELRDITGLSRRTIDGLVKGYLNYIATGSDA